MIGERNFHALLRLIPAVEATGVAKHQEKHRPVHLPLRHPAKHQPRAGAPGECDVTYLRQPREPHFRHRRMPDPSKRDSSDRSAHSSECPDDPESHEPG